MRAFFSVILVTALLATDAFAGPGLDNPLNKGGLAPGKPAGIVEVTSATIPRAPV